MLTPNDPHYAANEALRHQIFGDTDALEAAVKADPRFQQAAKTQSSTEFEIHLPGDADPRPWHITVLPTGHITGSRGSVVKPLLAAAAVFATGGLLGGAFAPAAAATDAGTAMIGGTGAGVGAGAGTSAAMAGTAAGTAAGAGGRAVADGVKTATDSGLSAIEKALLALSGVAPALMAGKTNPDQSALMQKQRDILGIQESRMRQQDPLYQAVQRLSMSILPTYAQNGPRIGPELPGGNQ